jgi:hypothetical protein
VTLAVCKVGRVVFLLLAVSAAMVASGQGAARAAVRRSVHAPAKPHTSAKPKPKAKVKGKASTAAARVAKPVPPPPMVGGRVAVFAFRGEDGSTPVRTEVVNLLRSKGLNVVTTLLPVDSAEQYRDMAATLGLAVYVHGEVRDNGERAKAVVHIRSGVTGRKIKSVRFTGTSGELPDDVGRSLWGEVGPAFLRTCAAAAKPRKGGRAPMRIEAGTPQAPSDTEGT